MQCWAVGPGLDSDQAMWMTHVYQWAGGLLWSGHGHGKSVWALFGLVQEWIGRSRACAISGACEHTQMVRKGGSCPESIPKGQCSLKGRLDSSVSWEHTQLVRREGGRLDSTLKGMNSLEDGCSIETGFMEVPWKE
ncbi:hypothetical protein Bca52824_048031 [Brassica carinata]|uniref:Uncharacterized protein n=1 Tax=Brassica carinata TaxID=52824 RepID=A0A8X7RI69_BRACI|nr:hypothetical protein Bca52824_048031 [Brassica carinata]